MNQFFAGRRLRTTPRTRLSFLVAVLGLLAFTSVQAQTSGTTLSTLMYFNGVSASDGLTLASDGKLYGPATSVSGGAPAGLIYRVATDGTAVDTVYQYGRLGVFTGNAPRSKLLQLSDGLLYGTTSYRSAAPITNAIVGTGTIFKISTDGTTYTKLHDFKDLTGANANNEGVNEDGVIPQASLIQASDGLLYGITVYGGPNGTGTIFKVGTDGSGFQSIFAFDAILLKADTDANGNPVMVPDTNIDIRLKNTNGAHPTTKLTQGPDGFLYGTTSMGGVNGTGTIYKIRTDGTGFQLLKSFDVSPAVITDTADPNFGMPRTNASGGYPSSGLLFANGALYGTTNNFATKGYGNVYSISTDGTVFNGNVHSFDAGTAAIVGDGASPSGELIIGNNGMLIGTTAGSYTYTAETSTTLAVIGTGAIYQLSTDGTTFNNIYTFSGDAVTASGLGAAPTTGVLQAADGSLYGATSQGGPYGIGSVFKYGSDAHIVEPIGTPPPFDDGSGAMDEIFGTLLLTLLMFVTVSRVSAPRLLRKKR